MKLSALLIVATISAALLAGCGSSDDSSQSDQAITTSELTKAQFIKRAEAACVASIKPLLSRITAYEEKHVAPTKQGNEVVLGKAVKSVVPPVLNEEADQIRSLGAPSGDEEQVEAFLVAVEAEAGKIKNGPSLSSLEELDDKFRQSGKLARKYGLVACSYG